MAALVTNKIKSAVNFLAFATTIRPWNTVIAAFNSACSLLKLE